MWEKLKHSYRQFKEDEPGERFVNTHRRWREHSHGLAATVIIIVSGVVLIAGGFLLGLVPGVPGIVLGLLGFALIAARFRRMAIWLDWCETKVRKGWRKCCRAMISLT